MSLKWKQGLKPAALVGQDFDPYSHSCGSSLLAMVRLQGPSHSGARADVDLFIFHLFATAEAIGALPCFAIFVPASVPDASVTLQYAVFIFEIGRDRNIPVALMPLMLLVRMLVATFRRTNHPDWLCVCVCVCVCVGVGVGVGVGVWVCGCACARARACACACACACVCFPCCSCLQVSVLTSTSALGSCFIIQPW